MFAHEISELRDRDAPFGALAATAAELIRTLSRIQTLASMHPELTTGHRVPSGSVSDEEWDQWDAETHELDALVSIPAPPAKVVLHASGDLRGR